MKVAANNRVYKKGIKMSKQIVEDYGNILFKALQTKAFTELLEIFADEFEAKAKLMGREYHFNSKDKFEKFLANLPAGIDVDIKEIVEKEKQYSIAVKMGMGMLKIPSEWIIKLHTDNKISYFEIR